MDAPAEDEHRPAGVAQRIQAGGDGVGGNLFRLVGLRRVADELRRIDVHALQVVGDVDQHRAGPAGLRDRHRLLQLVADPVRVFDQDRVLGDRAAHLRHLGLLETDLAHAGVAFRAEGGDVAGEEQHRHRVVVRAADAGDQVGRAGAAGGDRAAHAAGDARVGVRRHGAGLLVLRADVGGALGLGNRVDEVQRGAARDDEGMADALLDEELRDDVGELHRPARSKRCSLPKRRSLYRFGSPDSHCLREAPSLRQASCTSEMLRPPTAALPASMHQRTHE